MELEIKSNTKILKSSGTFTIPVAEFEAEQSKNIVLIELQDLEQYERENVSVNILSIGSVEYV